MMSFSLAICQAAWYNHKASEKASKQFLVRHGMETYQPGDVGFRQTIRLLNCRPRCRYAFSLNNRQNNRCQQTGTCLRSRCLISSKASSIRPCPVGPGMGVENAGCYDDD